MTIEKILEDCQLALKVSTIELDLYDLFCLSLSRLACQGDSCP